MSAFSETELGYLLDERRLGRLATVGRNGTPPVVPVAWSYNPEHDAIDIGGRDFARTKKFRDDARSGRAAIVVDDLASTDPWRPRAVEVRGRAEAIQEPRLFASSRWTLRGKEVTSSIWKSSATHSRTSSAPCSRQICRFARYAEVRLDVCLRYRTTKAST